MLENLSIYSLAKLYNHFREQGKDGSYIAAFIAARYTQSQLNRNVPVLRTEIDLIDAGVGDDLSISHRKGNYFVAVGGMVCGPVDINEGNYSEEIRLAAKRLGLEFDDCIATCY